MKILVLDAKTMTDDAVRVFDVAYNATHVTPLRIRRLLKTSGLSRIREFSLSKVDDKDFEIVAFVKADGPFSAAVPKDSLPSAVQDELRNYKLYKKAISFAEKAHDDQTYTVLKLPYTFHLKQTDKVIDRFFYDLPAGKTMTLKTAAWLHDVLEDTCKRDSDIEAEFGPEIAGIVQKVSKIDEEDTVEYEQAYYTQIAEDPLAIISKMADKCANAKQTFKTFSSWHAKRMIGGHRSFQELTYGKVDAPEIKRYLDSLISGLERLSLGHSIGRPLWPMKSINCV